MWYEKIIQHIAKKACPSEERAIASFVQNLFYLLEIELYDGEEPEPLMLLGVIVDLYNFVNLEPNRISSLSRFAEELMGLVILHAKSAEDIYDIKCSDFIMIIEHPEIANTLQIKAEREKLKRGYLMRERFFSSSLEPVTNLNRDDIQRLTYIGILKRIEYRVFSRLKQTIKVDLYEVAKVLDLLLNEMGKSKGIVLGLRDSFLSIQNKETLFDEVIWSMMSLSYSSDEDSKELDEDSNEIDDSLLKNSLFKLEENIQSLELIDGQSKPSSFCLIM
jgi:hypothetical protein